MENKFKRFLSMMLSVIMVLGMLPANAFATNEGTVFSIGPCKHHECAAEVCGVADAIPGVDCTHEHDPEDCTYAEEILCECTAEEGAELVHAEECGYVAAVECDHEHDEDCGFVEAKPAQSCMYMCAICGVQSLIDALPTEFASEEEVEAFWTKIEKIDEAMAEIDADLLDLTNYDLAVDAAAAFVNPEFDDATTLEGENEGETEAQAADGIVYAVVDGSAQITDGKSAVGDVVIPETVTIDGVEYAVTSIAGNAFNDANEVTSIVVPNSVTSLGGAAFSNMDKLKSLTIGNGVTSWGSKLAVNNYELETVVLAEGATLIGDLAFRTCPKLANVTLPSTLKTIGGSAFAYAAIEELTIPASVESIGADSFKDIDTLKKVTFLGENTNLGTTSFQMCDGLEEVVLPANLTVIPQGAFRYCTALKTIEFPATLTEIGNYSFQGCTSLEEVTISKNITKLVTNAFNGCTSLKDLTIEEGFAGTIGGYVFQGCTALESVVIPSSMETVGESMFNMCSNLKNVTLSEGVKTLNISAFANCTSLESLTLPDSLEKMRHSSIANCTALKTLTITGDNLPVIEHSNALEGLTTEELVVVYSGEDAFTGNWSAVADQVADLEEGGVALVGKKGYATLADAIAAAQNGDTITLLDDITLDKMLTISGDVTISGGKIIRADSYTGTLFQVNAGATLTLDDDLVIDGGNAWTYTKTPLEMDMENGAGTKVANHITPAEGGVNATAHLIVNNGTLNANKVTIQNSYSTNGVSAINCGASSVTVLDGATMQNIAADRSGAVVYVGGADAVLTIKSDTRITGNFGIGNGGIIQNYGQGTIVNMEGGSIDNNHVGKSGTVYASHSGNADKINTFNMSGGKITENVMEGYGPVYIHTNTVWNMTGGEISDNLSFLPNYVRGNNNAATISGGKIVNNKVNTSYNNGYYASRQDIYLGKGSKITGGTFTQDVSAWLAPGYGLVYDEATGTYGTTDHIYNLYFRDPMTGKQAQDVGPLKGNDPTSLVAEGKSFYANYYVMELEVLHDAKIDETIVIDYPMTVNLNGKTLTAAADVDPMFRIESDVVVTGNGKVDARNGKAYAYILGKTDGTKGNLTIENGTHYGEVTVASVTNGTLTIKGGNFAANPYEGSYDYTLNCIDANYKTGDAKIVVEGGVFYKFNPMNNAAEGANTNFVANGYTAVDQGNDKWTVEKANVVVTGIREDGTPYNGELYFADIYAALDFIKARDTATIKLMSDFTITADQRMFSNYSIIINAEYITLDLNGKTVTFDYEGSTATCYASIAICNKGTLTIIDSSEAQTGTLYNKTKIQGTEGPRILWVTTAGSATIEGGNFISEQGDTMFYASNSSKEIPTTIYIKDGYFEHTIPTFGDTYRYFNIQDGGGEEIIEVSGGRWAHNPSDREMQFPEGFEIKQNEDGTYGVVEVNYIAEIGEQGFTSLSAAITAATAGDTITLIDNVTEDVTVNKAVTIDGAGKTYTGKMTTTGNVALTVQNVNFVKGSIDANTSAKNRILTVKGCTFDGVDKSISYAITVRHGNAVIIENSTAKNYSTGMLYVPQNVVAISIKDVAVENVQAAFNISYSGDATFENVTLKNVGYGIHFQIYGSRTYTVKNCDLSGATNPFWFWDKSNNTAKVTVVFEGNNIVPKFQNPIPAGELKLALGATLTAPEGLNITTTVENKVVNYADGVYSVGEAGLKGSGTQADPYQIHNLDDLILFQESVNSGEPKYNAEGIHVALMADIDLASVENWEPIGNWDATFDGNFNGNGHKIMNLKMSDNTAASGEAYLGFFGITANNVIENFVIENVTINSNGQIVAAAIAYPYYTTVKNITVSGDIAIKGGNYTAGVLAYTRLCTDASNLTVSGNAGSYITGAKTVGGVIADIQTNHGLIAKYSNFSVSGVTITGNQAVGGISGIISGQTVNGVKVENVTLNSSAASIGIVAGSLGSASTISNVVSNNVTGATAMIGAGYDSGTAVEAKIGDTYYATLEDALKAEGDTVELLVPYVVEAGETVVLDLNGKTVMQEKACTASYEMISNKGNLTIKNGTVSFKDTGAGDPTFGWGSYTIRNEGTLVVENANIEHLGEQNLGNGEPNVHMYCAIFQYSGSTTINGGTISTPTYRSIRLWKGDMTINNGTMDGQVWVQAVDNTAKLTINGGTFSPNGNDGSSVFVTNDTYDVALSVTGGTFNGKIGASNASKLAGAVTGGKFTETAKNGTNIALLDKNCKFSGEATDGYYSIVEKDYVAKIGEQGYETFAAAYEAAAEGDTIVLLKPIVVAKGETLTLDKNVNIVYTSDVAGEDMITVRGTLNVKAGKITYVNTDTTGSNVTVSTISAEPGSVLNVTGGTVENKTVKADGSSIYSYAIDLLTNGNLGDVTANISGGTVYSDYMAIRQFNNGTACKNTLNVTGGYIYGAKRAVQVHMDNNAAYTTISGGKIEAGEGGYALCLFPKTSTNISVTGGEFVGTVYSGTNGIISGGIYSEEPYEGYVAEGFKAKQNADGKYGIEKIEIAAIGNVKYASLQAAVDAAKSGATITLLMDAEGAGVVIDKNITINFGGFTYTLTEGVGSTGTESNGFQILKGNKVTLTNGGLEVKDSAADKFYTLIQNYADLTITHMTLDGKNLDKWSKHEDQVVNGDSYVVSINSGTVLINGKTTITANDEGSKAFAFDVCKNAAYAEPVVTVKSTVVVDGKVEAYYKVGETYYASLQQAVNATDAKHPVQLIADASGAGVVIDKDVTINFNNFTYTLTEPVGSKGTESNGFQILKNNTVVLKNGTLKVADEAADKFYILIQNYANLNLNKMILDGTNLDKWSKTDGDSYVVSNNSGKVDIVNGTTITANKDGDLAFAFDVCDKSEWGYDLPEVFTATTATINGKIEAAAKIGYRYYATLQQALDAAQNNQTVTLMSDIKVDAADVIKTSTNLTTLFKVEGKNITLDMNRKTIDVNYDSNELLYAVMYVENGATLTVKGDGEINLTTGDTKAGKYDCVAYMFLKNGANGTLNIENGTFTANKVEDSMVYTNGDHVVKVKGGNWTLENVGAAGKDGNYAPWIFNTKGQNERSIDVSGGTYNFNVAKQYWAFEVSIVDAKGNQSYVIDNGDGTWTVSGEAAEVAIVEKVGDYEHHVGYATFKDAVAAIGKNAPETTIKLLKNITVKGQFIGHSYAQKVVIDLNGFKMSSADKTLTVYRAGTEVTIKNGTVAGNSTGGTIQVTYGGKLTLGENVTVTSGGSANALKVDSPATLIIADETVKVLGGAKKADIVAATGDKVKIEISAGYFAHPVKAEWCAEGYVPNPEQTADGWYTVMKSGAAMIGTQSYETLHDAFAAVKDGDTIEVMKDIDLANETMVKLDGQYDTYFMVEGKDITVDLCGKTISGTYASDDNMLVGVFSTDNEGHLTIKGNGTVDLKTEEGSKVYALIANYEDGCSITIEDGTFTLDKASDSLIYTGAGYAEGEQGVWVKGGTFVLGNEGTGANGLPWIFNALSKNQRYVYVTGGTFNTDVNHQFWANEVMVPETLALKDNGDGTWTVVEAAGYVVEIGRSQHSRPRNVGYADPAYLENKDVLGSKDGENFVTGANGLKQFAQEVGGEVKLENPNITMTENITVAENKELLMESESVITFNGNGKTITANGTGTEAGESYDYGYVGFIPANGCDAKVENVTVTGSGFVEVGHHGTSTKGNYTINNLTVENLVATLAVNNGGNNIAAAFGHYGNATMTDCVMTGTTTLKEGFKAYDAAFVNTTKTNIIGGLFGKIYLANQAHVTITGAEIDVIDSYAISTKTLGKLVIGAGAKVGTINLYDTGSYKATLTIEAGAEVDAIVYNGVTYTQAEWLAR